LKIRPNTCHHLKNLCKLGLRLKFGLRTKSDLFYQVTQCVCTGQSSSTYKQCISGVPQGSVLGPLLFTTYISPISNIAFRFGISLQQCADDTQLYISASQHNLTTDHNTLESCLKFFTFLVLSNGLALNSDKSETILFGTSTVYVTFLLSQP